jgi:hypothetical protein
MPVRQILFSENQGDFSHFSFIKQNVVHQVFQKTQQMATAALISAVLNQYQCRILHLTSRWSYLPSQTHVLHESSCSHCGGYEDYRPSVFQFFIWLDGLGPLAGSHQNESGTMDPMLPAHIAEHSPLDLESGCVDSVLALARRMFGIRAEREPPCVWSRFFCSAPKNARVPTRATRLHIASHLVTCEWAIRTVLRCSRPNCSEVTSTIFCFA